MLKGSTITLRPVHDTDLDQLYAYPLDIDNRGDFFPRGIVPQPFFYKRFQESGARYPQDVHQDVEIYAILHKDVIGIGRRG